MLNEQTWQAFDGIRLNGLVMVPENPPRAVLAFIHGHGTHSRRYEEWFNVYLDRGFAVISFDQRGHGLSEGKQGSIVRYHEYLQDAALLMEKTAANFPGLPVVLYGHSMGATILLSYLSQGKNLPGMAILSSAWLELVQPPGIIKSILIRLANAVMPQFTISTGLKSRDFAPAQETVSNQVRDPLMHKRISARCFLEVQKAAAEITASGLPRFVPLLFLHGNSDRVSSHTASRKLAEALPECATYREWEDGPHQLHAWDKNEQVTQYTIDWINDKL